MKQKSMTAPINLPTDPPKVKEQIRQLLEKRYRVTRPTVHQIKVGKYNWYWGKGSITIDPCITYKNRGFEAFLELIEADVTTRNWRSENRVVLFQPISEETL